MSDDKRKQLLIPAEEHPKLFLHIIDRPAPQGGFHPQPSAETPDWCTWLKCRDIPSQSEFVAEDPHINASILPL